MNVTKQFYVHGWDYSPECLTRFIETFNDWDQLMLEKSLEYGGGKSFGAMLAALPGDCGFKIVEGFNANHQTIDDLLHSEDELKTREWVRHHTYLILRSSQPSEDWLDGRAGVHESVTRYWKHVWVTLQERISRGEWFIVQPYVFGIGFVVDVGFSELLGEPVVRIAHGNAYLEGDHKIQTFTSATWDHESRVGIYRTSGEAIVPLPWTFGSIAGRLVRQLVRMLEKLGINFGVQLELVIHPDRPEEWNLVQLRPSPAAVRGPRNGIVTHGELAYTTGKVSGAGDVEGDALCLERGPRSRVDFSGKIIVWDRPQTPRAGVGQDVINATECGALGHIAERSLMGNSAHGSYGGLGSYELEHYQKVRERSLLMAPCLPMHRAEFVHAVKSGRVKRLRLVSDGLVGQVYRI